MPDSLQGKIALVTGSSRGIGRAIAERLGREGASVAVTYHSSDEKAAEVAGQIEANGEGEAATFQTDVRNLDSVRQLFDDVIEHFGRLDILVNNAAGRNIFKPTAELTEEDYDSMFDITRGVYFALQEAAKRLEDDGRIISISTAGTAQAMAGGGAYAGSKAAVEQFSRGLAKELGPRGITVNTVSPGITDTDSLVLEQEQIDELIEQTPMGRLGQPEDIADAVSLLASEDAHWVTGQSVRATGGIV